MKFKVIRKNMWKRRSKFAWP